MITVNIDITIRSQQAKEGADEAAAALKKVKDGAQKAKKAQDDLNKATDEVGKSLGKSTSVLGRFGRAVRNAITPNEGFAKRTEDLGRAVRLVDGPLGGVASRFQTLSGIVKQVNPQMVAVTLATAGFIAIMKQFSTVAVQVEKDLFRVSSVLEISNQNLGLTTQQVDDVARSFGALTLSSREAALQASASLLTFENILGDNPKERLNDILEIGQGLTAAFGGNLESNVRKVARALQDPSEFATILRRQVGSLSDEQERLFETLQRTGRKAEAQALIIDKLSKFQSIAAGEAQGYAGTLDTLGENFRDLISLSDEATGSTDFLKTAFDGLNVILSNINESLRDGKIRETLEFLSKFGPLGVLDRAVFGDTEAASQYADTLERLKKLEENNGRVSDTPFGPDLPKRLILLNDLGKQLEAQQAITAAARESEEAYNRVTLQKRIDLEVERELAKIRETDSPEKYDKIEAEIRKIVGQRERLKATEQKIVSERKRQAEEARNQEKRLNRQNEEVALLVEEEQALLAAAKLGTQAYEQRVLVRRQNEQILQRTRGLEEKDQKRLEEKIRLAFRLRQEKERELDIQREAERFYEQLEGDLSNTIEQGLRGGAQGGFDAILDYARSTFYRELSTILAQSVLNGLVIPASSSLAKIAGASTSGGIDQVAGSASIVDSFFSLSNLSSLGTSLTSSVLPQGVTASVDAFGQSVFGIGEIAPIQGPLLPGQTSLGTGVTNGISGSINLANIGAGIAGGFAANQLFGGGIGTNIGSSLGGIGAGLAAASLGPVGAALAVFGGSFLGGGLGSLFGNNEPSSRLQSGVVDLATGQLTGRGGLRGDKFSEENQQLVDALSQTSAQLAKAFGVTDRQLSVAASDRFGLEFAFGGDLGVFDADSAARQQFSNANDFFDALTSAFAEQASIDISEKTQAALARIDFGQGEEALQTALSDVDFALNFEKIFEEPVNESLSQVEQQVQQLNDVFDRYLTAAERLQFSQEDINRLEERRVELANDYIDSFIQQRQATTQAEQAIKQINEAYDDLIAATEKAELGVAKLAEVENARARDLAELTRGFEQQVTGGILDFLSPRTNALAQEGQRFRNQIREAEALGADLQQVELLHKLNLLEIEREYGIEIEENGDRVSRNAREIQSLVSNYERLTESLEQALFSLRVGGNTTLTPSQRLAEAESRFLQLRDRALSGDLDAASQLASVGNEFLSLSRSYNAVTEDFVEDFNLVERTLEETKSFAISQLDVQRSILATLEKGFNDLLAELGGVEGLLGINENVDVFTSTTTNAAGRNLAETAALGLSVGQIESVARDLLGGYTGPTGGGELNRLLAQNNLTSAFDQALRNLAGFATGGVTPTGAPFVVGENGPEIMTSRSSMRVTAITEDASRQIEQGNQLAAQQISTLQSGFTVLSAQMDQLIVAQQQMNANAQVSRIRRAPK